MNKHTLISCIVHSGRGCVLRSTSRCNNMTWLCTRTMGNGEKLPNAALADDLNGSPLLCSKLGHIKLLPEVTKPKSATLESR